MRAQFHRAEAQHVAQAEQLPVARIKPVQRLLESEVLVAEIVRIGVRREGG